MQWCEEKKHDLYITTASKKRLNLQKLVHMTYGYMIANIIG